MARQRKGTVAEQAQRDYFTTLRSFLRRASTKWPEITKAKYAARRPYIGENKKQKWEYQCNICKQWKKWGTAKAEKLQVDHIKPCGTFLCPDDYKTFIPTLFCLKDNLQILCKVCHDAKSAEEKKK